MTSPSAPPTPFRRFARFAVVGASNTAVDLAVFSVLFWRFGLPVTLASVVGYSTGVLNSFVLNRLWTFGDHAFADGATRQFAVFVGASLAGLAMNTGLVWIGSSFMAPFAAKASATIVTLFLNYWLAKSFVYRPASAQ